LVVAIPAGLVAAGAGWNIFTRPFGIEPPARIPGLALLSVAVGTVAAAIVVGAGCALSTRHGTVTRALAEE
jgi:hypothetical protein